MLVKAIEVGYLQTNCYVVADETTLDAAVIDPGADSNLILDYIERCHFHVRAILLTHGHFDHCMGLEEVCGATGATVYMSHAVLFRTKSKTPYRKHLLHRGTASRRCVATRPPQQPKHGTIYPHARTLSTFGSCRDVPLFCYPLSIPAESSFFIAYYT